MGLFDFLRKPSTRPPKPALVPVNSGQRGATGSGPSVAYVFAHHALPFVAFQNPGGFLISLSDGSPNRQELDRLSARLDHRVASSLESCLAGGDRSFETKTGERRPSSPSREKDFSSVR